MTATMILILLLVTGDVHGRTPPSRVFRVEEYGARPNDPTFNSAPAIQQAITDAMAYGPGAEVVLGPGRFMVQPEPGRDTCVRLDSANGITVRGVGAQTELISTTYQASALRMNDCRNTCIKDLSVDYAQTLFAVGTVREVHEAGKAPAVDPSKPSTQPLYEPSTFDVDFSPAFAMPDEEGFPATKSDIGYLFDAHERHLKAQAPDFLYCSWRPLENHRWRVHVRWPRMNYVAVGDRFVVRRGGGDGIWINNSHQCRVERVAIYACPGVGVAVTNNTAITLDGVSIRFREGSEKLVTSTADGMHCSANTGPLIIKHCFMEGMLDDAININSHNSKILTVRSPLQVIVAKQRAIAPGQRLQVVDQRTGTIRQEVTVAAVATEGEQTLVTFTQPVGGMRGTHGDVEGDYLYNVTLAAPNYIICDNHFRYSRRYAMLLHSGPGLIEGNVVEGVSGYALMLGNDPSWGEGPLARDVTICNNVFRGVGYCRDYGSNPNGGAITIMTSASEQNLIPGRPQHNLSISNNRFENIPGASMYIGSAQQVRLTGNTITADAGAPIHTKVGAIVVENANGVMMARNRVTDLRRETTAALEIRQTVDRGNSGITVTDLKARLAAGVPAIDDRRKAAPLFCPEDYGARVNDPSVNSAPGIQRAIDAAIAAGPGAEVALGAGRYYIKPAQGDTCLHVNKANGLVMRGQGSRTQLISTDPACAIMYYGYSRNTTIGGFSIDYDPLPFTQAGVIAVYPEKKSFDVRIDDGFPSLDAPGFPPGRRTIGRLLDRTRQHLKAHAPDHFGIAWEPLGNHLWRVRVTWAPLTTPFFVAPGDVLAVSRGGNVIAAIWVDGDTRSVLRDVTMHASSSLGLALTGTDEFRVDGLRICYPRGSTRLQSTDADGIHCSGNRGGPIIENCYFEGMADDGININCHSSKIIEVRSPTQVMLAGGMGAETGWGLQIFDIVSGTLRATPVVTAVAKEGDNLLVTFDRPVAAMKACSGADKIDGDIAYNLAASGEGYIIRNNVFRRHRRHAILARPGNGLIEGNIIDDVSGGAIVLENDYYSGEGPLGEGIIVRGNTIRGASYAMGYADFLQAGAIEVRAYQVSGISVTRNRRDIVITGNHLFNVPGIGIYVGGAHDVCITDNKLVADAHAPRHSTGGAIVLDGVDGAILTGNRVNDPRTATSAAVEIRSNVGPGKTGVVITNLEARLAHGISRIDDRRDTTDTK